MVLKSGSLNFQEHSGPVQACTGIALLFTIKTCNAIGRNIYDVIILKNFNLYWLRYTEILQGAVHSGISFFRW